jgi:hypothetical protein
MKNATKAICLLLFATSGFAQSLPLQGYYRAGQYMPVKIGASGTTITGMHMVTTIASPSPTDRIVPVLFLDESATEIQINNTRLPLQPLRDTQRLVGLIDTDPSALSTLFATEEAIQIRLAFDDLRSAIPLSFDSLDALVLSPQVFGQLPADTLGILLDCSVTIAVRSTLPPDSVHTWQRNGDVYVVQRTASAHFSGTPHEAIYDPALSWRPQRSGEVRWLIVSVAGFVCVAFLALCLLPRKWPAIAAGLFAGVALVSITLLSRHPHMQRSSMTAPYEGHVARYFASADDQHFEETLSMPGYPVPFSLQHASDLNLQLHIRDENVVAAFDLNASRRMCILNR